MRLILNVIWFVLAGLWMAIGYAIAALIMFVLIVTRFRRSYAPIGATSVHSRQLQALAAGTRHRPGGAPYFLSRCRKRTSR